MIKLEIIISVPTFEAMPELNFDQAEALRDILCQRYLEGMTTRDLERFYLDEQYERLMSYSDEDLLEEIRESLDQEAYEEVLNELAA